MNQNYLFHAFLFVVAWWSDEYLMLFPFWSLQVKIQKDSEVRLKIIGTRVDATEIVSHQFYLLVSNIWNSSNNTLGLQFCIGTIKDDFLGVISDPGTTS